MPWKPGDAEAKTKKARSPTRKRQWAHVANSALAGGASEGSAVRQANTAVKKSKAKRAKKIKHRGQTYHMKG